jgi:Sigma-54 interaction domain
MWYPSPVVAFAMRAAGPVDRVSAPAPDWQLSRAADVFQLLGGIPRVNLLLVGVDREMWRPLETKLLDLREPVSTWSPGAQLRFPAPSQTGSLILNDVEELSLDEQRQLLEWLEPVGRSVRVISTTSAPLFPRVEAGAFNDTLYYRLNTVTLEFDR